MGDVKKIKWEVWVVDGQVLGIRTIEAKPKTLCYNHGREFCEHIVGLHNALVGMG